MGLFSRKKTEAVPEQNADIGTTDESETAEAVPGTVSDELIAVIAAAVAAYEAEQFRQTLYIQKVNRTCGTRPVWGVIGTQEAIDTRRM